MNNNFESILRSLNMKLTQPRIKILELLNKFPERHLTVEQIYEELKNLDEKIGIATVYRIVASFEEAGLLIKHHFEGENAKYEIKDEFHHDHIINLETGETIEFYDKKIEELKNLIANKYGFELDKSSLTLYVRSKRENVDLQKVKAKAIKA